MALLPPVFLLCTGVSLNLVAQQLTDLKFSDPNAHLIPWIKFFATMIFAILGRWRTGRASIPATSRQRRLMTLIGLLDASAYVAFCLGFMTCGAALSSLVLSSAGQIFTALATRFILRKKIAPGQVAAIACVCLGLLVRSLPPSYLNTSPQHHATKPQLPSEAAAQRQGVAYVLLAALLYSGLGVAYEALVASPTGATPPPYPDILWNTSLVGFTASSAYLVLYVVPRWEGLVGRHMAASGVAPGRLMAWLAGFGAAFNVHMFAQSLAFKSEGALGVTLVNAVRGAVITVLAALLFCSPDKPLLCWTPQSGAAAALTTLGGAMWALSGASGKSKGPSKEMQEAREEKKLK